MLQAANRFGHGSLFFNKFHFGGDNEIRTHDPLLARQVLSQLSYTPTISSVGSRQTVLNLQIYPLSSYHIKGPYSTRLLSQNAPYMDLQK